MSTSHACLVFTCVDGALHKRSNDLTTCTHASEKNGHGRIDVCGRGAEQGHGALQRPGGPATCLAASPDRGSQTRLCLDGAVLGGLAAEHQEGAAVEKE